MKLTAGDLEELGICDLVIPEDGDRGQLFDRVDRGIRRELRPLIGMSGEALVKERYRRFRRFGGKRQKG